MTKQQRTQDKKIAKTVPVYVRYDMQAMQYLIDNELYLYNKKTKESYAIITE